MDAPGKSQLLELAEEYAELRETTILDSTEPEGTGAIIFVLASGPKLVMDAAQLKIGILAIKNQRHLREAMQKVHDAPAPFADIEEAVEEANEPKPRKGKKK